MKIRDILKRLKKEGWVLDRQQGSHRQYVHPQKEDTVTIPGKPGDDVAVGTLHSIEKQAGWRK